MQTWSIYCRLKRVAFSTCLCVINEMKVKNSRKIQLLALRKRNNKTHYF